jgi:hypothetical protein
MDDSPKDPKIAGLPRPGYKEIMEALAMRRFLFFLLIPLVGCDSDGIDFRVMLTPAQHIPEISNLKLSPDNALKMAGGGSVQVTAEFTFKDLQRDIETLNIRISDETTLAIPISSSVNTVFGTLTETFDVPTTNAGGCSIEIWVVDEARQSSNHLSTQFGVAEHVPEITDLVLTPDTVNHMEGDGSVVVSAEIMFRDVGSDIQTLWVEKPDGTTAEFNVIDHSENQSITVEFDLPTDKVGSPYSYFWLVDMAGDRSGSWSACLPIIWNGQSSGWMKRLSNVPYGFWDVVWDGTVFVAVGDDGAILTSSDGVDWVKKESGVDTTLVAVAAFGSDIVAVGNEIVLLSTDHGDSWSVKYRPVSVGFGAVALNSSQYVVGGFDFESTAETITISEDRGETWEVVDEDPNQDFPINDIAYGNGYFVATTWRSTSSGGRVKVSADGRQWNEILVSEDEEATRFAMVMHDGDQFTVAGYSGVSMSVDGLNWTKKQTPLLKFDFLSAATDGSQLILAGGFGSMIMGVYALQSHWPAGIASTDGGLTWELFGIDEGYLSLGMAFGNGRFVSVGRTLSAGEDGTYFFFNNTGAIYSSN